MKRSFDDVVQELTIMIRELQEYIHRDNPKIDRYLFRQERIELLKQIREHYQDLSDTEKLLKKSVVAEEKLSNFIKYW